MTWIVIIIVAIVALIGYVISIYNGLVTLRVSVDNCWAHIDVQLKRRFDMIPNLISTVKAYAAHEKETLENVIKARNMGMSATTPADAAIADNMLTGALSKLFALAEAYPNLKANENFMELHNELVNTENRISMVRQSYNDSVMTYNTKIQIFPDSIIAGMFHFTAREFFKVESAEERQVPAVNFN